MPRKPRRRAARRILRFAAIGALGAWLVKRRRNSRAGPEGEWHDYLSSESARRGRDG